MQLGSALERKTIAKELSRLRGILTAIDQLEQCGEECTDARTIVQQLWDRYNKMLKAIYSETPETPPWTGQSPTQPT